MLIYPVHQRMAELWVKKKARGLTEEEKTELEHCLDANVKVCWRVAYLENLSLLASMSGDVDWQHEICKELDSGSE